MINNIVEYVEYVEYKIMTANKPFWAKRKARRKEEPFPE